MNSINLHCGIALSKSITVVLKLLYGNIHAKANKCVFGTLPLNSPQRNEFQFLNIKLALEIRHTSTTGLVAQL
jgi:hypothetical protein